MNRKNVVTCNPESPSYKAGYEEGMTSGRYDAKHGIESRENTFPMEDAYDIGFREGYALEYEITALEMVLN